MLYLGMMAPVKEVQATKRSETMNMWSIFKGNAANCAKTKHCILKMYQQHEHVNVNWLSEFIGYVSYMKCQRHVLMVTCVWIFDPGYCYSKWRQLEAHSSLRGCKT